MRGKDPQISYSFMLPKSPRWDEFSRENCWSHGWGNSNPRRLQIRRLRTTAADQTQVEVERHKGHAERSHGALGCMQPQRLHQSLGAPQGPCEAHDSGLMETASTTRQEACDHQRGR